MTELPPVQQSITVALSPEAAFALFTRGIARWWPFDGHSCSGAGTADVVFDERHGGSVTEIGKDGSRHPWGTLTAWEPPHHFAMTWHPAQSPDKATALSVKFVATASGCEIRLVHGGWLAHGDNAEAMRGNYEGGWGFVLGRYLAEAAKQPL